MSRVACMLAVVGGLTASLVLLGAAPASAHVERTIGPIDLEIGFGTEPAYLGEPNSVQVILSEHGSPVVDLGDTLKVQVSFGGQQTTLPLEPNFEVGGDGQPGDYRAWFIPSQAGPYTFELSGSVHGTKVNLSVTSGPTTFNEVTDPAEAMFPAVDAPTTQELSTRIEQDSARLTAATADTASATSAADDAKTVAIIGVIVGLIGIAIAIWALVRARRGPIQVS
ncbi:MAG TPA: hypothetical protein VIK65_08260 [Candidatus Limnocylindrales bacterium]|jgi:hypothetical protein